MVSGKGALVAPFAFVGLACAAAGSLVASPSLWFASIAAVLLALACDRGRRAGAVTPLSAAVWAYAAWVMANDLVNSVYTPAGLFHPALLVTGFTLARSAHAETRRGIFAALLAGTAVLAAWALWQSATGEGRAHAHFETPSTLATVLNLLLAPLLVTIACGRARRWTFGLTVLLAAALTTTLSRGGFIALAGGLMAAMVVFAPHAERRALLRALAALGAGGAIGASALWLVPWIGGLLQPPEAQISGLVSTLDNSAGSRVELYRLAFSALNEHPWIGAGYLGFRALLDSHRAAVPSYAAGNITYFVHDDYLQTLMELGLPGLLALVALIVVPFWLAKRSAAGAVDRPALYAPLAGIATMAIHALGDFPFYVPVCLLVFGMLLGEVDATLSAAVHYLQPARRLVVRVARLTGGALLGVLLVAPVLAEAASAYGERSWRAGRPEPAAYGLELARRLQPRDWRYHWYAGQFWYAQAAAGNAAAAPLADRAFAAAVAANPSEPRPLLGRFETQVRFGALLADREPSATLRSWADRALALAPLNPAVRRDYAAALEQLSRVQ